MLHATAQTAMGWEIYILGKKNILCVVCVCVSVRVCARARVCVCVCVWCVCFGFLKSAAAGISVARLQL